MVMKSSYGTIPTCLSVAKEVISNMIIRPSYPHDFAIIPLLGILLEDQRSGFLLGNLFTNLFMNYI
jgi:hypothetical protein